MSQIFVQRYRSGSIRLLVVKVIDDFLIAGSVNDINAFVQKSKQQFEIGCVVVDRNIKYNGAEITKNDRSTIKMSMKEYCTRINPIDLSHTRKKQRDEMATPDEIRQFQHLAGVLNFLGRGALPHASYVTSHILQRSASLKVTGIIEANSMLKEIGRLSPVLTFAAPEHIRDSKPFLATFLMLLTTFHQGKHTARPEFSQAWQYLKVGVQYCILRVGALPSSIE